MQKKRRNYGKYRNTKEAKADKFKSEKVAEQKYNDPEWYIAKDQLAKDVASLSFNTPLGNTRWISASGIAGASQFGMHLPGILTIYAVPSVSPSNDGSSVINIAAKNLYSYVRHQNSGHSNYDSPDLMLYIMAMDSVYSMISWMQSLYGTAMVFAQTNRYYGDALIQAKGAKPEDIRNNLADFRAFINQYIIKASAFCVPTTMSIFKRHFWMYSNAFKDEATTKSQLYVYAPALLYQYNLDNDGVGFLDPLELTCAHDGTSLDPKICSLLEIKSVANALLDQLQYSEDINIMSGDILKAYGRENLWRMDLIPEGYGVFPVYSEEILDQIHNTTFTGRFPVTGTPASPVHNTDAFRITQRTGVGDGALLYNPKFAFANHLGWDQVLDMHSESPDPGEVLVATRNMVAGDVSPAGSSQVATITTCGSDLCLFAKEWVYENGTLTGYPMYHFTNAMENLSRINSLSKFNKYPRFYAFDTTSPIAYNSAPVSVVGEIDNYTIVDNADLDKIHDSALLNMFGVPTLGLVG